jgi:maltoporin
MKPCVSALAFVLFAGSAYAQSEAPTSPPPQSPSQPANPAATAPAPYPPAPPPQRAPGVAASLPPDSASSPPAAWPGPPQTERGYEVAPSPTPAPMPSPPTPLPPVLATPGLGFDFGSYGRIGLGSDLHGHEGYGPNVVSHGTRLELPPYLELNFYYTGQVGTDRSKKWRIVLTPAFASGDLFHYTGDLDNHVAIRNAYAEVDNVIVKGLTAWAGSRMYRGDDIYLFNYWPLDNLNTVGGGLIYRYKLTTIAWHIGMNLLDSLYQFETLQEPAPGTGPASSATVLDRPRLVTSLKITQGFWNGRTTRGAKVSLYGEVHELPSGSQIDPTSMLKTALPSEIGWVAGLQLSGWLRDLVFINFWFRAAGGLATYGDLSVPNTLYAAQPVGSAREYVGALSGNYESKWFGVMFAGYVRRFVDPTPIANNPSSYTEGIIAARPTAYLNQYLHFAVELSYQKRVSDGVDPYSGRVLKPNLFRASFMPILSPTGRGTYARPNLYAVYSVSTLDRDSLGSLYVPPDFRANTRVVQYLGGGVEWWFNSSYR